MEDVNNVILRVERELGERDEQERVIAAAEQYALMLNLDELDEVQYTWLDINNIMRRYYENLLKLQAMIQEKENEAEYEVEIAKLKESYTSLLRRASWQLEELLQDWNGEGIVDIFDYIFEKFHIDRVDVEEDDDEYLNANEQEELSHPPVELLKRVYDELLKRYKYHHSPGNAAVRQEYGFFIEQIYVYLPNEYYIEHFLQSFVYSDYDYLILMEVFEHQKLAKYERIQMLSQSPVTTQETINSLHREFVWLYKILRFAWCIELCYLQYNQRQVEREFQLSVKGMTEYEKYNEESQCKEWFEEGISRVLNIHLDELQLDINELLDDIERANVVFEDNAIQIIVGKEKMINTKQHLETRITEIQSKQMKLSRNINKECYNINFKWVKDQIMKEYEENVHLKM